MVCDGDLVVGGGSVCGGWGCVSTVGGVSEKLS